MSKYAILVIALQLGLMAQTNGPDGDLDGVPDTQDRCPSTPHGGLLIADGCSAMELVQTSGDAIRPVLSALDEVSASLGTSLETSRAEQAIKKSQDLIATAAAQMRFGNVCDAASTQDLASTEVQLAHTLISGIFDTRILALAGLKVASGDARKDELQASFLHLRQTEAEGALTGALDWARKVRQLCSSVQGPLTVHGRVVAKDENARRIVLDNGNTYALAEVAFDKPLVVGQTITASGTLFSDATGVITSYDSGQITSSLPPLSVRCAEFRIAPVQRLPPFFAGPYTLHDLLAYQGGYGILLLEEGMYAAAANVCSSSSTYVYTLKIDVIGPNQTITIATGLQASDPPVYIPRIGTGLVTIKVTQYRVNCLTAGYCSTPVQIGDDSYSAAIQARGYYSRAVYDRTLFEVSDDGVAGNYQTAKVVSVTLTSVPSDANPVFSAEGYKVINGQSSRPNVGTVIQNQPFAVYDDDFFNEDDLFPSVMQGVDRPSGLRWPRISGTRNGKTFWYSTELPRLVRDRISSCSESPDAYYKLPFQPGKVILQGPGNYDDPKYGHGSAQPFAFDMLADEGTPLVAARGGKVVLVEERDWLNKSNYPKDHPYFGNYLWIRHEDGTYAVYFHLRNNGAIAKYGDKVHRGDLIAEVGNTGQSSAPHVHFEAMTCANCPAIFPDPPNGTTYPSTSEKSRFQLKLWNMLTGTGQQKDCYIPRYGDFLQQ